MMKATRKTHALFKILNNSLIDMPLPSNITFFWNMGSLLGLCLMTQILTGLFLAMHYTDQVSMAFDSISHICREVNYGWLLRTMHANGASFFFIFVYLHIGRGIYYGSYMIFHAWMVGVFMLFMLMAAAFLGYVLPWGQMSFWGATVITNLFSAIPFVGEMLVQWIWGGFSVNNSTLTRFFSFHFIIPLIIAALTIIHILFLHKSGASNPMGMVNSVDKLPFHPYFTLKDMLGFILALTLLLLLSIFNPYLLGDPDNFVMANPMVTPVHIQPEWYFLFAYAILRSIPSKLGGVMALVMAVAIIMILPFTHLFKFKSINFYPLNQMMFWCLIAIFLLLTWIGARPVEEPYMLTAQILTTLYFSFFCLNPMISIMWDKMLK